MVEIPGWAFAGAGAAIAAYSKFIDAKRPSGVWSLFFWLGILLVAFGAFKIVAGFITGEKKAMRAERAERRSGADRPAHARDSIVCPRCNAKLHPKSRYCNWCGTQQ